MVVFVRLTVGGEKQEEGLGTQGGLLPGTHSPGPASPAGLLLALL